LTRPRALLALALALSVGATQLARVPLAFADAAADAKDLFAKGRELRAKGDCANAIEVFRKAYAVFPAGIGSLRNIAECEESLGRFASARRDWLELKRAVLTANEKKYEGWDVEADAAAARLAPKIGRLTIVLVDDQDAPLPPDVLAGLSVTLDGDAVAASLLGTELDRDPGAHAIAVKGGLEPVEETTKLDAGQAKTVKVSVKVEHKKPEVVVAPPVVEKPEPTPTPKVAPDSPKSSNGVARTAGFVSLGVAGVAAIGTVAFVFVRSSALSQVESKCPGYESSPCGSGVQGDVDRGKTASKLVNVFGAIAIVSAGVGLALVLSSPSPARAKDPASSSSVTLAPVAFTGGGGAFLSGSF
jgi:hypothetical protein